ncbi:MAG: class I SAM-dependent methyltransferase [Lentisphaeria bacterium]
MHKFSPNRIAVHLMPAALRAVRSGHPWVYDRGIRKQNKEGAVGDLAVLFDRNRNFVGLGLYDPESPIRVRVLHQGEPTRINTTWLGTRLERALNVRDALMSDPRTTGYRLVHGENDGLPGLVIDGYEQTLVIKLDTAAWVPHLPVLTDLLIELLSPERVVLRLNRTVSRSPALSDELVDGTILHGPPLKQPVIFLENGLRFEADPISGQKTGFFLDQRENRARVENFSRGKDVLNVFAYTGGFSLYAARGGATRVVSLDISKPALVAAERNFALNEEVEKVAAAEHETACADAFEYLSQRGKGGRKFGLVILDPPSFARKQAQVNKAVANYERLARLGLECLKPKGILVAASCSSRVPAEVFFQAIQRAASQSNRPLHILERTTHAADHPVGFPEGAYLKCLFARA